MGAGRGNTLSQERALQVVSVAWSSRASERCAGVLVGVPGELLGNELP